MLIDFNVSDIPMFPTKLTWYNILFDLVGIISLIIAASYYIFISRNTIKTRKAQLFLNVYNQFRDYEFLQRWSETFFKWEWKNFDDFIKKYGPINNIKAFSEYLSMSAYFEGIGVLVKNKLIDIDIVEELMSSPIIWMWEKTESVTNGYREYYNSPELWEWYEYLYTELKNRAVKKTK